MWEKTHKYKTHVLQLNWTKHGTKFSYLMLIKSRCYTEVGKLSRTQLKSKKLSAL